MTLISIQMEQNIISKYFLGLSSRAIAKELGTSKTSVLKYLKINGINSDKGMLNKHHSKEAKLKSSISHKKLNFIPWNKGQTNIYSEDTLKKMGEQNKGKHRSPETECKKGVFGEKTIGWKGGLTSLQDLIRKSQKYIGWRNEIYNRDFHTCQKCDKHGGYLNAHHKKRLSLIIKENNITSFESSLNCDELWNLDNGITLCEDCHKKTFGESWVE